jgi:hypothetical protein
MAKLEPLDEGTEKFLAQFKPRTRETYRNRIKAFSKDTGIIDVLSWIKETDAGELKSYLQIYYNKQIENKAKINSVLATVTALRSIATEFGKTIKFRKGTFDKVEEDQNAYEINSNDLARLWDVADLTERAILATATSLGYEISSFLNLKREKTQSLVEKAIAEKEEFTSWVDNRSKTSAKRLNVLNPLAIEYLKKYFDSNTNQGYELLFPYGESGINVMLKRLFKKASIDTAKQKIRFHAIRKWLMTKLNEAGLSIYSVKLILGKEIEVSDSTYLNHLEQTAFQDYKKVYGQHLAFANGRGSNHVKQSLEEAKSRVEALEDDMRRLREENKKLRDDWEKIKPLVNLVDRPRVQKVIREEALIEPEE